MIDKVVLDRAVDARGVLAGRVVLHWDRDLGRNADVTGRRVECVVAPGTADRPKTT